MNPNYRNLRKLLMIPGPTPVPHEVAMAGAAPMINHRSADFKKILEEIISSVKKLLGTSSDVLMLTASGTGGLEAAVVNALTPGDKVLGVSVGSFGERFQKIAETYGAQVQKLNFEAGHAADPEKIREVLDGDKNKEIKMVLVQHNETSTGVLNDIKAIASVVQKHGALCVVDAVSGFLAAPLEMDAWGLDIVVSGSQKAFMVAPGLAFVAVSSKAWQKIESSKCPNFYFSLKKAREFAATGETPWTPAIATTVSMHQALKMIVAEGKESIYARHALLREAVRAGVKALGFSLLAQDHCASPAITSVVPPKNVDAEKFRALVRNQFGVVLAGGQGNLKGKIFRIGHLGYVDPLDIVAAFGAIEMALKSMGESVELGKSVRAVQEVFMQKQAVHA